MDPSKSKEHNGVIEARIAQGPIAVFLQHVYEGAVPCISKAFQWGAVKLGMKIGESGESGGERES